MITIDEIKKKIEEVQAKSAVSSEMKAFITLVLTFVNKSKEELSSIGSDNLKKFKDAIGEYAKEHEKIISNAIYNTEEKKKEFDKKAKDLEVLIAHLESLELKSGEDGDDGHTPKKGEDYFTEDDKKEICDMVMGMMDEDMTAEEMVAEINKLPLDDDKKIDASHIKGLPEGNGGARGRIVKVAHDDTLEGDGTLDNPLKTVGGTSTDEKVKYDVNDPTAGYVADKVVAGTGISVAEGTGGNENKLVITNTLDISGKMDKMTDPDANRIYGWDDTDNAYKYFTIGTGLTYDHATHTLSATASGYTNLTEFINQTPWRVFYSDGNGDVKELALGADGTFLKSNGATSAPSFSAPAGSGDVLGPATNTDSYIPQWDGANSKALKDGLAVPDGGLAGLTDLASYLKLNQTTPQTTVGRFNFPNIAVDTDTLYTDSVNHRVGIGTTSPAYKLDVSGTGSTSGIRSSMGFDIYQVPDPTAPTGVVSAGGSVNTGVHYYAVTYITATGETHSVFSSAITTTTGNNTVTLTIPVSTDPRVTGRKIYRTKVGEAIYQDYLLTTIANNTDTTYVDTLTDSSLTGSPSASYFRLNTTSKNITVNGTPALTLDSKGTIAGFNAGRALATGGRYTIFGKNAGVNLTTGTDANLFGESAGANLTTGLSNHLFGYNVGLSLTTGSNNSAFGHDAMVYAGTSSTNNCAFGYGSGWGVVGNVYTSNAMFGVYSGYSLTTGSYNTALGTQSLYYNTTGANNTALGYNSGRYIADGTTGRTTGNNGLYLGYNSKASADGTDNEIVIGYNAIGNGSNTATIGNASVLRTYLTGVNLKAGTATAGTAPLKFTSGTLLTTAEAGAVEFLNDAYYGTITTGAARKQFAFTTDIVSQVEDSITDGVTTKAPSENAVFDALANKQPLATVLTNTTASFTTAQETKLSGIAAGAEVNVNADWNAVSGDAQILNKPTISGTNTGDQDATDFDIKDLTDSTNLRTTWSGKQDALIIKTGTFTSGATTYQKNDTDVTANSIVDVYAQSTPIGGWTVESYAGYFIITSTKTETSNVDFKYIIHN